MSTLVIATSNPHKLEKLTEIFKPYFDEIKSLIDYPELPEIEENGSTFAENARIKAQAVSKELHLTVVATDAGATIPALGDSWNALRTRRFVSEEKTDEDRVRKLISMMQDKTDRRVWFTEAYAICKNGEVILELEVKGPVGHIKESWDGRMKPGAWLLAVWHLPNRKKDFFDLTPEEINAEENTWATLKEKVDAHFNHD